MYRALFSSLQKSKIRFFFFVKRSTCSFLYTLLLTILGSRSDFHTCWTPRCAYVSVINTHSFGRFWPISWTITYRFGVPEWFPWLTNLGLRFRVGHQHSWFWPILARFVDYYSLFWGPGVISTIDVPQCAFTCRSSTLAVLSILTRFVDYTHRFWGPKAISMVVEPQRVLTCWSSRLAVWANSVPFHRLLFTILGSQSDFHD